MEASATSSRPVPYWKCVAAALPLLVTGAGFLQAGVDAERRVWLIDIMLLERVVLTATLVTLIAGWFFTASLRRTDGDAPDRLRGIVLFALMIPLTLMAIQLVGGATVPEALERESRFSALMLLVLVTYLGLVLNWDSGMFWFQFLLRSVVSALVFLFALVYAGVRWDPRLWPGNASVIEAGAIYFLGLGSIELTGFYQRWFPAFARRYMDGFRKTG